MLRSIALIGVCLVPFLAIAGDTEPPKGWKAYPGGFKKEAYIVWLPDGKIDEKESNIVNKSLQIRVFRTVSERKDGAIFAAGQIILPPQLVKEQPKVRQAMFRDMFLEEVKGKLVSEKAVKLDTMAGKEYIAKTDNGMARYRIYGTGVLVLRQLVVGTKDQVEGKDADIFFDSFKRTPPKEKAKDK
jgi:hypothetical protein